MKDIRTSILSQVSLFFSLFFLLGSFQLIASEGSVEVITEIILINRQAELVEMDEDGEILKRHLAIPDYFTSGKSHSRSLRESLRLIRDYGEVEESYFLPGSSTLPAKCLQSFMLSLQETKHETATTCLILLTIFESSESISSDKAYTEMIKVEGAFKKEDDQKARKSSRIPLYRPGVLLASQYFDSLKGKQRIQYPERFYHGAYKHLT